MLVKSNLNTDAYSLPPEWVQLRYHPVQSALWRSRNRFAIVVAGRGSGKTELAMRRLTLYLRVQKPHHDPRYFFAAPTYGQAKSIAWKRMLNLIPQSWIRSVSTSELVIETIFGSEFHVIGLDKPQRIEGIKWDGGVIDESSDIKPGVFDLNIYPTLTWRNGWCWRIGVPKRYGVGASEFKKVFEQASAGRIAETSAFTWPSSDILPPEALTYARKSMDARDYDEQFGAHFITATGGIYYAFSEDFNVRPCVYNPQLPLVIGSDFNVDPMAWVICQKVGDTLCVIDELYLRNTNTPQTLDVLYNKYSMHKAGFQFYGDAASRARHTNASSTDYKIIYNHEGFKRLGRTIHYPQSNPPIADRYAAVNALICNAEGIRRLFVDPKCKQLIRDFKNCTYKPGTREPQQRPDEGHITDAIGYVIIRLFPITLKNIDNSPQMITITPRR